MQILDLTLEYRQAVDRRPRTLPRHQLSILAEMPKKTLLIGLQP